MHVFVLAAPLAAHFAPDQLGLNVPKISRRSLGRYRSLTLQRPQLTSISCPISCAVLSFYSPPRLRLPPASGKQELIPPGVNSPLTLVFSFCGTVAFGVIAMDHIVTLDSHQEVRGPCGQSTIRWARACHPVLGTTCYPCLRYKP